MGLVEIEDFYLEKKKNRSWPNNVKRRELGRDQELIICEKMIKGVNSSVSAFQRVLKSEIISLVTK